MEEKIHNIYNFNEMKNGCEVFYNFSELFRFLQTSCDLDTAS